MINDWPADQLRQHFETTTFVAAKRVDGLLLVT